MIREIQTPVASQVEGQPETLVTNPEEEKWHRVVNKIHIAAKAEIDLLNQVFADTEVYAQGTEAAREQLHGEAQ